MTQRPPTPHYPPPTPSEWALLAINIAFVAMGLVILPSSPDVGIVTLAFFGSCLLVSANTVIQKYRFRRLAKATVHVAGGVPIKPSRTKLVVIGVWLIALGVIMVVFGHAFEALFRAIGAATAAVGAILVAGVWAGYWPRGFLRFDPDSFTIAGRSWSAHLPWDEIVTVRETELSSNPILLLSVRDPAGLLIEPQTGAGCAAKSIAQTQATFGADFAIMTAQYEIDLPVMTSAIVRYVTDKAARDELRPQIASASS